MCAKNSVFRGPHNINKVVDCTKRSGCKSVFDVDGLLDEAIKETDTLNDDKVSVNPKRGQVQQ
jgi:hypothetical protein